MLNNQVALKKAYQVAVGGTDLVAAAGRHTYYHLRPPSTRSTSPLRIGIDVAPSQTASPSGIGRYIALLADALPVVAPEDAFTFLYGREQRSILGGGHARVRRLRFPVTLFHRVAGMPGIELATGPVDVFHCQIGFTPPFRYRTLVLTIHDVRPFLKPEGYQPEVREALCRHFLEISQQATLIITDTQVSAAEIVKALGVAPDRIRVVPLAADPIYARQPSNQERAAMYTHTGLADRYVLALGTLFPHKNHVRLVHAFAKVAKEIPHILVLAGAPNVNSEAVAAAIAETGMKERILLLGYVDYADLPALIAESSLFIQPSLYEGFGLPVLDAMAAGAPVACSNVSAMPEAAGSAAEYFDPYDISSMADTILRLLRDPDRLEALRAAGSRRVTEFSWEETARRTAAVYREAAQLGGSNR